MAPKSVEGVIGSVKMNHQTSFQAWIGSGSAHFGKPANLCTDVEHRLLLVFVRWLGGAHQGSTHKAHQGGSNYYHARTQPKCNHLAGFHRLTAELLRCTWMQSPCPAGFGFRGSLCHASNL